MFTKYNIFKRHQIPVEASDTYIEGDILTMLFHLVCCKTFL